MAAAAATVTWPGGATETYRTKGFGACVAGKYSLPIGERFKAFAKLGLARKWSLGAKLSV